jgi:GxxExxY protein
MYIHDALTHSIIGCGIAVHRELGPGLPESVYEEALCIELADAKLSYTRQVGVPVLYKSHLIGEYRPDIVVNGRVVVEVKSVESLSAVHQAQTLAYMRILRTPVGLLINFNSEVLRTSIKRLAL